MDCNWPDRSRRSDTFKTSSALDAAYQDLETGPLRESDSGVDRPININGPVKFYGPIKG